MSDMPPAPSSSTNGLHSAATTTALSPPTDHDSPTVREEDILYIVARYLSASPFQTTFNTLLHEIQLHQHKVLPNRIDWAGRPHALTYHELNARYNHIPNHHLHHLLSRLVERENESRHAHRQNRLVHVEKKVLGIGRAAMTRHASRESRQVLDGILGADSGRRILNPGMMEIGTKWTARHISVFKNTFRKLISVKGHLVPVYSCLFDRSGLRFFTGGDDQLVKVWDTETGWLVHTIRGHRTLLETGHHGVIQDMAVNEDNTVLATASSDKTVRLWDMDTFQPLGLLRPEKQISLIAFSPSHLEETKCLIVIGHDTKVRVYMWDQTRQKYRDQPIELDCGQGPRDKVTSLSFNRTGTQFVTGTDSGAIYVHSVLPADLAALRIGNEGGRLLHEEPTPKLLVKMDAHRGRLTDVMFGHHGDNIASGGKDGFLRLWSFNETTNSWKNTPVNLRDLAKEEEEKKKRLQGNYTRPIHAPLPPVVVESVDSGRLPIPNQQAVPRIPPMPPIPSSITVPDVSTGMEDVRLDGLETPNPTTNPAIFGHHASFDLPSRSFYGGGADPSGVAFREARLPIPPTSSPMARSPLRTNTSPNANNMNHPDGASMEALQSSPPHPTTTVAVAAAAAPPSTHAQKPLEVSCLLWTLDDSFVIVSSSDHVLRVIEAKSGNVLHSLHSHSCEVFALDCHPKLSNIIASGSYDGSVIIWDIIHGKELARFIADDGITCCKFSTDGYKLIACDITGVIHIFGLSDCVQSYKDTPQAPGLQAFEYEFHLIREDQLGGLVDEQTQLPASVIEDTQLVLLDLNLTTYPEYERVKRWIRKPVVMDQVMLQRDRMEKQVLFELERDKLLRRYNVQPQLIKVDKPKLQKMRRKPQSDADDITKQPEWNVPVYKLPDEDADDEDFNEEEGGDDSTSQATTHDSDPGYELRDREVRDNFVIEDDEYTLGSSRSARTRSRKSPRKMATRFTRSSRQANGSSSIRHKLRRRRTNRNYAEIGIDDDAIVLDDEEEDDYDNNETTEESDVSHYGDEEEVPLARPNRLGVRRKIIPDSSDDDDDDDDDDEGDEVTQRVPPNPLVIEQSDWVAQTKPREGAYVPQIHDRIAIIHEGQLEFSEIALDRFGETARQPFSVTIRKPPMPLGFTFGLIEEVRWHPYNPLICTIKVLIHSPRAESQDIAPAWETLTASTSGKSGSRLFSWFDYQGPEFVLLYSQFRSGVGRAFEHDDDVWAMYDGGWFAGRVVEVKDNTVWKKYKVAWDNLDDAPEDFSPWELELRDDGEENHGSKVLDNGSYLDACERMSPQCRDAIMELLEGVDANIKAFFDQAVDYQQYDNYLNVVAYPIWLALIKQRLLNDFYRRTEAVAWDVEQMAKNAEDYNDKKSLIWELAHTNLRELAFAIESIAAHFNSPRNQESATKVLTREIKPGVANEEADGVASDMDVDVDTDHGNSAVKSGFAADDVGVSAVKHDHDEVQEAEFTDTFSVVLRSSSKAKARKASPLRGGRARKKAKTADTGFDEQSPESDSDDVDVDVDVVVKPIPAASGPLTSWKKVMKKFYPDWGMLDSSMPEFVKKLLVELELKPTSVGGKGEWGIPESLHGYLIYRLSDTYGCWNDDPIDVYRKPSKSAGRKPAGTSAVISSRLRRREEGV
ncbi:hypothetical protein SeMB42_g03341 [Synchytrium endobioticum]|uniref:Bromo domain-containing protein n=1 Tax=Synchytrium endobioticum TaxID=286115 RepID=A0A507D7J2_9FUNG|nr:hypothetical protein SeMB42_g03341 [Synchytrium endobioticum]